MGGGEVDQHAKPLEAPPPPGTLLVVAYYIPGSINCTYVIQEHARNDDSHIDENGSP